HVDRMLVILPFEQDFYRKHDYPSHFVGHPLLDAIEQYRLTKTDDFASSSDARPIIALLPGSRKQEIRTMLPVMLSVVSKFPEYRFVIAAAPSQELSFYSEMLGNSGIEIVQGATYDLLRKAHA
ncbi:MAG: lipid-A-disaccharide synthase, partial [Flavobacteriales bacterium]